MIFLLKKIFNKISNSLIAVILSPIILIVILLKPIVLIRFGVIDASRIGHICISVGYIIDKKNCMANNKKMIDVISISSVVCNQSLINIIKREIRTFLPSFFTYRLIKLAHTMTGNNEHEIRFPIEKLQLLHTYKTPLRLNNYEDSKGKELLHGLGIPDDSKWICIHNRDSAYLDKMYSKINWDYHKFRDFEINSLEIAAEMLSSKGYYILRMGAITKEPFKTNNKKIIDYANHKNRSDIGDIYLMSNCELYLGSDAGIFTLATIFNRPYSLINFTSPSQLVDKYSQNPIPFIIKHVWSEIEGRCLSIREIFNIGLFKPNYNNDFIDANVKLISNTSEEISDLAGEVVDRVNGTWIDDNMDLELQKRFWMIFHELGFEISNIKTRIGSSFLRKNIYLLE